MILLTAKISQWVSSPIMPRHSGTINKDPNPQSICLHCYCGLLFCVCVSNSHNSSFQKAKQFKAQQKPFVRIGLYKHTHTQITVSLLKQERIDTQKLEVSHPLSQKSSICEPEIRIQAYSFSIWKSLFKSQGFDLQSKMKYYSDICKPRAF